MASVAASETGSPASACSAIIAASSAADAAVRRSNTRSIAQNTNGTAQIDHDMFGKFVVDTVGPDSANAIAPSAAAGGVTRRRRNRYMPAPASGTGSAIHRLYAGTSGS